MSYLVSFFKFFWDLLYTAASWCLDGALFILKACLYFIFDGILTVIEGFFATIDLGVLASSAVCNWAGLPSQMIYLINQVGIPQGLTLLVTAITIRFLLNLIPAAFTRV